MNKLVRVAIAASLVSAPVCSARAQSSPVGAFGFLNSNGTFLPFAQTPTPQALPTPTVRTGRLVLNLSLTIASSIPLSTPIKCAWASIVVGWDQTLNVFDNIPEMGQVTATRSGATATCQVAIPYRWVLYVPGKDVVLLNYSVTALDANGNGRTIGLAGSPLSIIPGAVTPGGILGTLIPLPANGATTTISRSDTL